MAGSRDQGITGSSDRLSPGSLDPYFLGDHEAGRSSLLSQRSRYLSPSIIHSPGCGVRSPAVSRRENAGQSRLGSSLLGTIRDADLLKIEQLIENDKITSEVYQEKLDEILQLGHEADREAAGVSPAGQELLKIWNDMDAGLIKDSAAAYDEAERRVRERAKTAE